MRCHAMSRDVTPCSRPHRRGPATRSRGGAMANITTIQFALQTADVAGAGTDGDVYLGFCGREFSVDTSADDFERDSSRTYPFGEGANVQHAGQNDPRLPQLRTENIDRFPVYVRF